MKGRRVTIEKSNKPRWNVDNTMRDGKWKKKWRAPCAMGKWKVCEEHYALSIVFEGRERATGDNQWHFSLWCLLV